jgi:multiple sugar transport system substrate-binding protein
MLPTIDDGISNPASNSYVEEEERNVYLKVKLFATNRNYMYDLVNTI